MRRGIRLDLPPSISAPLGGLFCFSIKYTFLVGFEEKLTGKPQSSFLAGAQ